MPIFLWEHEIYRFKENLNPINMLFKNNRLMEWQYYFSSDGIQKNILFEAK